MSFILKLRHLVSTGRFAFGTCLAWVPVWLGLVGSAGAVTPWTLYINTNNIIIVTNATYGAKGDGVYTNTTAIQNAINAAANGGLTNGLRGGVVRVPAGTFLCGPLTMKSNVRLHLADTNAILRLLPYGAYPGSPYLGTVTSFISGSSITNIAVTGLGLIDGQGEPWWRAVETNSINRPAIISLPSCSKVLLQDFTSTNPPNVHVTVKGANAGSVNFIGIKLFAPPSDAAVNPSHNTDGVDFAETNGLFQDCVINTGDDNIAMGSSASVTADILVTNCFFGEGHGCSIGSYTSGGVSNLTVINCTFSNTGNGIKIKSQRDRGGVVQNLNYFNLTMTNVDWPVQFYSYYEWGLGTLTPLTPEFVANAAYTYTNPVPYYPPRYRNVTVSNLTANVPNGRPPFLICGLPDHPISNFVFKAVNLVSSSTRISGIYNATNIQFIDCSFPVPAGVDAFQFWNANVTFTNSALATNQLILDGLTTNGVGGTLRFYGAPAAFYNTNAIAGGAITLGNSTLTVSNNLTLFPGTVLNFVLGTNTTKLAVVGNLRLGGTNNISAGPGFTNGTYMLMTYTGTLNGDAPVLGTVPPNYVYRFDTNPAGQVNLVVSRLATSNCSVVGFQSGVPGLGTNTLVFAGTSNLTYVVQVATNLTATTSWFNLATNVAGTNGLWSVVDPFATSTGRFYRVILP